MKFQTHLPVHKSHFSKIADTKSHCRTNVTKSRLTKYLILTRQNGDLIDQVVSINEVSNLESRLNRFFAGSMTQLFRYVLCHTCRQVYTDYVSDESVISDESVNLSVLVNQPLRRFGTGLAQAV
jgi:hypothetical protein